jgi:RNA polymerase sigma factor (TIGR02999 family)
MSGPDSNITRLLTDAVRGDAQAAQDLLPIMYDELRSLAKSLLARERPGQTLQPTALVHDAYLRLVGDQDPGWNSRGHFFAAAALAMRRILVDQARRKARIRHGGQLNRIEAADVDLPIQMPNDDILGIEEALSRLEAHDSRKGQIVNMRYFAQMSTEETADALDISVSTVEREWRFCRRWLYTQLSQ